MISNFINEVISNNINPFVQQHNPQYTKEEAKRILSKYPDRIPVIISKSETAGDIPVIDKNKFLVPSDLTMGQFQYVIRKRLCLSPDKALFLFINNNIQPTSQTMSTVYDSEHDTKTLFLFVTYGAESTFG
jgi:GABA(A) receptor-associated protein